MAVVTKTKSSSAAIIIAIWATALLTIFVAFRSSDLLRIPALLGNLGGGPLFGSPIVDSVYGVTAAVLILYSWFSAGTLIEFLIGTEPGETSWTLALARSFAIGAIAWSLIWFFLGIFGLYSSMVAIVCVVAAIANGLFLWVSIPARRPKFPGGFKALSMLLIGVPVLLALVAALAPPTAKDALLYHFSLPKAFIAQHSNGFVDGNIASYLALGTEMHVVWDRLLGGLFNGRAAEAAGGAVVFLFFPLLLLAVYGWARQAGVSRVFSLIATLMVASIPTAFHVASSGYIDISLALYVTLAVYSLTCWWRTLAKTPLILAAIFLGGALAVKLTTVFVIAAFALVILLRARKESESAAKVVLAGFGALILAGVIASPWYLRNWVATGSPVFPFYMSIWKGEANGWDVERSNLFQTMNSQYGGDKNALAYLLAPWNLSVAAQPEKPEYFDGVLGIAFLFGLPILIWGLWKFDLPVEAKIASGVVAIMFLFWLFSSQQLRYLLPILPALAVAIAASADVISSAKNGLRQVLQYGFVAAGLAGILVTVAWFCQKAPLRVALGGESRDQYLTRNLDYYPFYQTVNNETAADARVWLINMRRDTYNIDRPVFSDYLFEDWTLRKLVWESRNVQELRAKAVSMNVQYVLTRYDFLFDYDRSTLVDDKKPRPENEAKLRMAKEFILDSARTVRSDNKFSLIKVF